MHRPAGTPWRARTSYGTTPRSRNTRTRLHEHTPPPCNAPHPTPHCSSKDHGAAVSRAAGPPADRPARSHGGPWPPGHRRAHGRPPAGWGKAGPPHPVRAARSLPCLRPVRRRWNVPPPGCCGSPPLRRSPRRRSRVRRAQRWPGLERSEPEEARVAVAVVPGEHPGAQLVRAVRRVSGRTRGNDGRTPDGGSTAAASSSSRVRITIRVGQARRTAFDHPPGPTLQSKAHGPTPGDR